MRFDKEIKTLRIVLKTTAKVLVVAAPIYVLWGYTMLFTHDSTTITPPQYGSGTSAVFAEVQQEPLHELLNINTADLAQLDALPYVTPKIAEAIIDYREHFGSFASIEELISVDGIGKATLERMRPYVTV